MLATVVLLFAAPARAQICLGSLPFDQAQTRVRGDLLFTTDMHVFGVALSQGFATNLFASAGLLLQTESGAGESETNTGFYLTGGGEWAVDSDKKFHACPVVTLAHVSFGGGSDTMLNIGGNVGFEAYSTGNTKIIPFGGVSFSNNKVSFEDFDSSSSSYLNIHLAVGFNINNTVSVAPQVVIPINSDVADNSFLVTAIVKIR
jgi:hypothetical protein